MEAPLEAYNLSLVMSNFWMTMETDAFRETKKLLRMRLQVSQCKGEKKDLLQLMQNHLFCAKLLKLTVMKGGQSKREYWIMTSNFMPSRKGNWVSEVFLETEEHRCLFEGHALNSLQREAAKTIRAVKEEERKVFFCINPLRYRMNECVHTFDVIPNFESQPSSRK
jgi:hypothetical protein